MPIFSADSLWKTSNAVSATTNSAGASRRRPEIWFPCVISKCRVLRVQRPRLVQCGGPMPVPVPVPVSSTGILRAVFWNIWENGELGLFEEISALVRLCCLLSPSENMISFIFQAGKESCHVIVKPHFTEGVLASSFPSCPSILSGSLYVRGRSSYRNPPSQPFIVQR